MSEVLPLARAARRYGVTMSWLKAEADAGRVPHLRAGKRYLFDPESLVAVLAARAASGPIENAERRQGVPND